MVLEGYIGSMRSGKTLTMTRELYKEYINGRKVYSNYWLNFPHEELDINDLDEAIRRKDTSRFDNAVIGIDEIHVYLDSRTSGAKRNRITSYFMTQSGKMNCRILWTSQFLRQVELRIRYNSNYLNSCKRFIMYKKKKIYLPQDDKRVDFIVEVKHHVLSEGYGKIGFLRDKTWYLRQPKRFFHLYDTLQKVFFVEQKTDEEYDKLLKPNYKAKKKLTKVKK